MSKEPFNYEGRGKTNKTLATHTPIIETINPKAYIPESGLCDAVNVALTLGQPLLVTGEPGTGKTQLAASIAYEYTLPPPLEFYTKSSSTATDLFYHYDALKRFNDAQLKKENIKIENYITLRAMGIAIILTNPKTEQSNLLLPKKYKGKENTRSVILIDEIDKAPRDFPNDILNEVEKLEFFIHETGDMFTANNSLKPIIIMTSNSEKYLPDAFLRRCVFFHISFPDKQRLKDIVTLRFEKNSDIHPGFTEEFIDSAITHFQAIRKLPLKKKPATAEFIAWLTILKSLKIDIIKLNYEVSRTYSVLSKNVDDLNQMNSFLKNECRNA